MNSSNPRAANPRRPVVAAIATLVGAAAIAGYSAFYLSSAIYAFTKCNPPPVHTTCSGQGFWGFGPTLFFVSDLLGIGIAVLLAVVAFLLMTRSEHHRLFGVVIIAGSLVSLLAFGGAIIGAAAGLVGGVVALVYRSPQYRGLVQWVAGPPRRAAPATAKVNSSDLEPVTGPATGPEAEREVARATALPSSEPVPPATAPSRAATSEAQPETFGKLTSALSGRPSGPGPEAPPAPPSRTLPPASTGTEPRRPLIPYSGPAAPAPPALPTRPAGGAAPRPAPLPASPAPAAPPVPVGTEESKFVTSAVVRRAWKCPKCGLTNAPWSRTCTQCKSSAPPS